ncbi:MAG: hypothetical protein ABI664_00535 [bacterium]
MPSIITSPFLDGSPTMLTLSSPRWRELGQAHGSAEDIPRLLEALAAIEDERERAELWFGVWATLCPDGPAVTAAYAAVPHLLSIAESRGAPERVSSLHAAATVEMNRHLPGAPPIPDDVLHDYALAIESLPRRVAELTSEPWDAAAAQILAAALLAGKRQPQLARSVLTLGED